MPVQFDMRGFERAASGIGALQDQIPFALSQSLNDGLFASRDHLITHTWPAHVSVRDPNFLRNALRVERASKTKLSGAVTNEGTRAGNRGHLKLHEDGGTKRPTKSKIAIPDRKVLARRSGRGVPKSLRPGTAPNTFRKGDVIYQVTGGKKNRKLKLLYTLKPSAPIKGVVPFRPDFDMVMRREVARAFPDRIRAAMASRRR
ncbi:hypothetical protein ABIE45_004551 [Methylobacterium sp. OAE515]|uniref:hypothetical protein n=1 Tax=Methylobacterium sp. OAE515 TaxID=2817895 RepID=UPI00178AAB43